MLEKLKSILNDVPRVAKRQFGFRAGMGTENAIYEVESIVITSQTRFVLPIAFYIESSFVASGT